MRFERFSLSKEFSYFSFYALIIMLFCVFLSFESFAGKGKRRKSKYHKENELTRDYNLEGFKELRTFVDIDAAELRVEAGSRNELSVSFYYKPEDFDADIFLDKEDEEIQLVLDKIGSLKNFDFSNEVSPQAFIELPTGIPIDFRGEIFAGEVDIDMRDIILNRFELDATAGEFDIEFGSPNETEIERLNIDINFGDIDIRRLGNTNFSFAKIDAAAGDLKVDLSGEYKQDSEIVIDLEIGETTVYLPEDVGIKLFVSKWWFLGQVSHIPDGLDKKGRYYYSDNYDDAEYKLFVKIKAGIGEVDIFWE